MSEQLLTHDQLQLALKEARSGADGQPQTNEQLVEHIIALYGAEFVKANNEIARLRSANDELFRIKQKVVIANRELLRQNTELHEQLKNARDALRALAD
jgi:hypothetical protein